VNICRNTSDEFLINSHSFRQCVEKKANIESVWYSILRVVEVERWRTEGMLLKIQPGPLSCDSFLSSENQLGVTNWEKKCEEKEEMCRIYTNRYPTMRRNIESYIKLLMFCRNFSLLVFVRIGILSASPLLHCSEARVVQFCRHCGTLSGKKSWSLDVFLSETMV